MDIALSSEHNFDRIADKLKKLHIKVGDDYMKPLHTDLCTSCNQRIGEQMSEWIYFFVAFLFLFFVFPKITLLLVGYIWLF